MKGLLRASFTLLAINTLLLGVIYPVVTSGVGSLICPHQAAGSLIEVGGKLIGSQLIGQRFAEDRYFWGRPSATDPRPYDPTASAGSNLGPSNPKLIERVDVEVSRLLMGAAHPAPVPVDLATASASGLDPDISRAAAEFQATRIAQARQLSVDEVRKLIAAHAHEPLLGFIGAPRVNVLELNLALDGH